MNTLSNIVNATYTFSDVIWYCWLTAVVVAVLCLAWHEFTSSDRAPDGEFDSARRKMMKGD